MSAPPPGRVPTAEEGAGLRSLVAGLARTSGRRPVPSVVHVGRPGGISCDFVDLPSWRSAAPSPMDSGLRTEVAAALLSRALVGLSRPVCWLTRDGVLVTEDVDMAWHAAARAAYAEADVPLLMLVVTRHGWYDPGSDLRREWRRLRTPHQQPGQV